MASGAALFGPWLAVLTRRLKRIEGHGPATAYCELALGALLIFEIILPLAILQVVVFRPERSPSETLILSDLFVLLFISPVYTFLVELLVTGIAILRDKQEHPVFPGWMGVVNLVVAVLSVPGIVVIFVKSGPFTWSGALGFWVPAAAFGIWVVVMTVGLLSPTGDVASEAPGLSAQPATAI
jgi:hypothetical protein